MKKLFLTERALRDIQDIYDYSVGKWGKKTAEKYLKGLESRLSLIKNNEGLLKINRKISSRFIAFPVQKHVMICDIINDSICVLTIKHVSMDLLKRLKELEPTLDEEAKVLFRNIK